MSNLKRYDTGIDSDGFYTEDESITGRWVKFDDTEELRSSTDVQQLKQAIALVRCSSKQHLYNNETALGFEFCLNIIEQRACI